MMQVPGDEVVDVVAVRDGVVSAVRPMRVVLGMLAAVVLRRAAVRILRVNGEAVIVHVIAVHKMQMSIVQVIGVVAVPHRLMPASGLVLMVVTFMHVAVGLSRHRLPPSRVRTVNVDAPVCRQ
jgi:hypothetical protein